ncbi:hypothetical protein, partial [Microvirga massiliensis]|uniref:hypothetical protein n=1 Tax=Microvirga massiliensis TaxID=1033741 RepID=UPI001AEC4901
MSPSPETIRESLPAPLATARGLLSRIRFNTRSAEILVISANGTSLSLFMETKKNLRGGSKIFL